MVGSDLESRSFAATNDILEMEKIGSTSKVNLHNSFQTLANLGKQNMADQKLSDFVIWGMSQFPAKKYAIVLWDHGSGTNGFGKDLQFKNDILNVTEMQNGFAEANKITRQKFELIGFDACLTH
jgi:hypothetical protein